MYIIKNAIKSIVRAKGRNILSFILILFIAMSACIALSVRNSAESAKMVALDTLQITAQINVDRQKVMGGGKRDKATMNEAVSQSLSIDEMQMYAESEYVDGFYYTTSVGLNVPEGFEIYEADTSYVDMGGKANKNSGDVTIVGYSTHDAMTTFVSGESSIYEGAVFEQNSTDNSCIISYELAMLNDLSVGDVVELHNPQKEEQIYQFVICGIFQNATTDAYANQIFTSFDSLYAVICDTEENAEDVTSEKGKIRTTALKSKIEGTYVFSNVENYEAFCVDVENMGLDTENYSVSSSDVTSYEQSIVPLESLSGIIMVFFVVVVAVGGAILVVFNMFCVRERKYEIGVLTAIGMKKDKVALQFLTESFIVTFLAVFVGIGVGLFTSEPVANVLLQDQIAAVEESSQLTEDSFGGQYQGTKYGKNKNTEVVEVEYLDSIDTSMDITIFASLMGIAILITVIGSSVGVISVLRYDPLKILSERT